MFENFSSLSGKLDSIFLFILVISVILLVLITAVMVYFVIKYNRKRHPKAVQIDGNVKLEIIWTVIPTILVLFMFYYGWDGFKALRTVPEGAVVVKVEARMWDWTFEYENGKKSNVLNVPVDVPVMLVMTSADVIHNLYIPAFRIKEDTVPGMETYQWFEASKVGTYDVLCAEYCGTGHSAMVTKVFVMTEDEFNSWYEGEIEQDVKLSAGEKLIQERSCIVCHSTDGSIISAPSFKGIYGTERVVVTDGKKRTVTADEVYLKKSILNPQADLVTGYEGLVMPVQTNITDEELDNIVDYLKELK